MDILRQIFGFVCGQVHNWNVGGEPLPFCQRCTGFYVGIVYALAAALLFRPRATKLCLWINGGFLLLMLPFGYHLVDQGAAIRTITGELFAAGLGYFLFLMPAEALGTRHPVLVRSEWPYFLAIGTGIPLLLASVYFGGGTVRQILAWMGFAGLVAIAALWSANLWLVPRAIWRSFGRRQTPPAL